MANLFKRFDLLDSLQKTLTERQLLEPTEIQLKAIPALLDRRSIVGVAETGSGKTLSFALPILHLVKTIDVQSTKDRLPGRPKALVVVPTRELGEQVARVFKVFTHDTRLRVRSLLGGTSVEVAKENVRGAFEILVATPGRLVKMGAKNQIDLSDVEILIFDEADQMLDPGFVNDAKMIVASCQVGCQIGLFSATVSKSVQTLMTDLVPSAEVFRTTGSEQVVSQLKTKNLKVVDGKRWPLLEKLLEGKQSGGTLIFTNTREQCDKLAAELDKKGVKCAIYRGEMDKVERRSNLKAFRDGKIQLLISTDLASRGLDVEHVGRVINYHMPQHLENYLHRVGRTARAGRTGLVINFVTERDQEIMQKVKSVQRPKL